ncbi:hypothetical protein F6A13_03640 [Acidithiobacillus sp. 'AMD consortium']|uniref:hypothetical protein n=1 Tax=Acidithiobacillus sp. 'AMD consortium' TaxID=2614801 RepID=UPI00124C738E|nr:hypothetical protein [Acidithiobacillus sp. 'AMD consortium']QFG77828.1 hypothetical protein F6A13_03640 [Acidithiobacillus sp. 'AMD consortium']
MMQLGKGTVLIGIMIGAVAVYLYVQHDEQVSHLQGVAMAQQRCTSARFDAQFSSSLGPGNSQASIEQTADQARAGRLCALAAELRKNMRISQRQSNAGEKAVGNAAGQLSGLPPSASPPSKDSTNAKGGKS